jgi:hypothetical protein
VVVVRWRGERHYKLVHSKQDAQALVQMVHKQELAGVNVIETIRQARAQAEASSVVAEPVFPTLRDACPRGSRVSSARARFAPVPPSPTARAS